MTKAVERTFSPISIGIISDIKYVFYMLQAKWSLGYENVGPVYV